MGSAFGAIWEDPEGVFIKFAVKRVSNQDQTLHMEGKPHIILYFREECAVHLMMMMMKLTPKPEKLLMEDHKLGPPSHLDLVLEQLVKSATKRTKTNYKSSPYNNSGLKMQK